MGGPPFRLRGILDLPERDERPDSGPPNLRHRGGYPASMTSDARQLLDPWFALLQDVLPPAKDDDRPLYLQMDDRTAAAVALTLKAGPEPEILLIRRAEAEGDPWSGHMALPGGRKDPDDEDLLQTAMRETLEETGLDLAAHGQPLGRMEDLAPNTWRLPPISIHPFVFAVGESARARVASHEVVETLWVPMSTFKDPAVSSTVEITGGGTPRSFPCFRVEGRVVWGLTYRILNRFFRLAPDFPPTRR